jgi:ElaB/YqjD/DUF883 family membrane-anchored ribosome-binding protein
MGIGTDELVERIDKHGQQQAKRLDDIEERLEYDLQSFRRSHTISTGTLAAYVAVTITLQPQAVVGTMAWQVVGVAAIIGFALSSWAYSKVMG